jgi:hypothetical protein
MLMIDHRSQRFEVRSRTTEPFRIAQLDLANASPARTWRPGGKSIKPGFATCKNRPIFEAVTTTGLLLERVDEALRGHR